jgi:hypothetical protein
MKSIFTMIVFCLNEAGDDWSYSLSTNGTRYKTLGDRVWGWQEKFEDAEEVILNNITDIFEYTYNYACIEEVEQGPIASCVVKQWYKAIFDVTKMETGPYPEVIKCDPPIWAKNQCNFSMG